jgi:hypothetical protein
VLALALFIVGLVIWLVYWAWAGFRRDQA